MSWISGKKEELAADDDRQVFSRAGEHLNAEIDREERCHEDSQGGCTEHLAAVSVDVPNRASSRCTRRW